MTWALPLPAVVPLLAAALVIAADHVLPRRVGDAIAVAAAAAALAFACLVLVASESGMVLHWFGGWRPTGGAAIGIAFAAEPIGAGMAAFASLLVLLALLYSWSYLRHAARHYDVLLLLFGGAMNGFALTGDLFNMFVWFEVMGVAAYALAGFEIRHLGPLQGAINFAVTNTVGAYLILIGIALLYARTGALNLAQIGQSLSGHEPDGLVIVALTLVVGGFLVKAAIVPFHLWLADAHAVAPAPVCLLYSGAMVELGLFAVARCYWTIFEAPFGAHSLDIRNVLLALGLVTAVLGAVMCFLQRHLKRLLAYSTISHAGLMLVGIALLSAKGLGGVADLVVSHGLLKGALFLAAGVLLVELKDVDELRLRGKGRSLRLLGVLFLLGGVGLIGLPYVGPYLGHAEIDEAASAQGLGWVAPVVAVTAAVSAAAILRAGLRIFLGWGAREDEHLSPEPTEQPPEREAPLPPLLTVTAVALALGLAASVVPGLGQRAEANANGFLDRSAYAATVLHGAPSAGTPREPVAVVSTTGESVVYGLATGVLAVVLTAFGLYRERLPGRLRAASGRVVLPPVRALKLVHSGVIGDYVMWLTVGVAVLGGVWALLLR